MNVRDHRQLRTRSLKNSSAVEKAIAVLELLAFDTRPVSAPDIADQLETSRQTVHRILAQLEDLGLVRRDASRERFLLGVRFNELALAGITSGHQNKLCHLLLTELVESVNETCNLGILDGSEVIYIDRVECNWPLRMQLQPGSRVPAYCTAIGKLLLAHLPDESIRRYLETLRPARYTKNTITDTDKLDNAFNDIRRNGYAINDQEDNIGLIAIAVPVHTAEGKVMAGLAVHGPEVRMSIAQANKMVPTLQKTASRLGKALFS